MRDCWIRIGPIDRPAELCNRIVWRGLQIQASTKSSVRRSAAARFNRTPPGRYKVPLESGANEPYGASWGALVKTRLLTFHLAPMGERKFRSPL